jgi:hypothetical protein
MFPFWQIQPGVDTTGFTARVNGLSRSDMILSIRPKDVKVVTNPVTHQEIGLADPGMPENINLCQLSVSETIYPVSQKVTFIIPVGKKAPADVINTNYLLDYSSKFNFTIIYIAAGLVIIVFQILFLVVRSRKSQIGLA